MKNYAEECLKSEYAQDFIYSAEDIYMATYMIESDLRSELENLRGIYMLEFLDGSRYIGSAFNEKSGIFNRFKTYMKYSAGSGNPQGGQAKKDALPKTLQAKFAEDREIFLTDDEDYIRFHILHTLEGSQSGDKKGIFDQDQEIEQDMLNFAGTDNYDFYQKLNDNQLEEKYFKELFQTREQGLNSN